MDRVAMETVKIDLGSGFSPKDGYFNLDVRKVPKVNILAEARKLPFRDNSIDELRASHIIEHFSYVEIREVLEEWHRTLKPNGRLKIRAPDLDFLCKAYVSGHHTPEEIIVFLFGAFTLEACKDGHFNDLGVYNKFDSHKAMYTQELLARVIQENGYIIMDTQREHQWEIMFECRKM